MHESISGLLTRYEKGTLSRRELITALGMLVATAARSDAGLTGAIALDHVSIQVSDLKRSTDFYRNILGLRLRTEPRADGSVRLDLSQNGFFVLRTAAPAGTVDHVAIKVDRFDKDSVTRQLQQSGVSPNESGGAGFHVSDPDGFSIQFQ